MKVLLTDLIFISCERNFLTDSGGKYKPLYAPIISDNAQLFGQRSLTYMQHLINLDKLSKTWNPLFL